MGNIEKATSISDLKEAFERYGEIVVSLLLSTFSEFGTGESIKVA